MVSPHTQNPLGAHARVETGAEIVYYIVRKIKGKYYLIKVSIDPITGKKKQESLGNCETIEETLKTHGKIKRRARRLAWSRMPPLRFGSTGGKPPKKFQPNPEVPASELVEKFLVWCVNELGNTESTCRDRTNYLRKPLDPSNGHSVRAYRLFYRFMGWDTTGLPHVRESGIDFSVPNEADVRESLSKACSYSNDLCIIYRLLIESGSRLKAVMNALNNYNMSKDKDLGGFYVYDLGKITKSKKTFYIYHMTPLRPVSISYNYVRRLTKPLGITPAKYIRKFVSTRMASLGIPSEVIDFIQGRTPKSILSRHYLNLYALAQQYYPKYADWLRRWLKD